MTDRNAFGSSESVDEEFDRLMKHAIELTGIEDRDMLLREALKALCAREAGRRLALMGGTMPDLEAPPRRRFGK